MELRNKTGGEKANVRSGNAVDEHGPSRKKRKLEWEKVQEALKCAHSALSAAHSSIGELEIQRDDAEAVLRDGKRRLECELLEERELNKVLQSCLDEQRNLRESCETKLQDQSEKVIRVRLELDDALRVAQERTRELERVRQNAKDAWEKTDRESQRTVNSLQADLERLKRKGQAELNSWSREKAGFQIDLDAARSKVHAGETEHDAKMAIVVKVKMKVESERDAALLDLSQLKAESITEREDKLKAEMMVTDLESEKTKLAITVDGLLEDAAEDKRKLAGAKDRFELAESSRVRMSVDLLSMTLEKNRLACAHEAMQRAVEEEREKNLCQICLEVPKDTITFPCLHLHYCFACLEKHKQRSKTCPTCRTPISGVLQSHICN